MQCHTDIAPYGPDLFKVSRHIERFEPDESGYTEMVWKVFMPCCNYGKENSVAV